MNSSKVRVTEERRRNANITQTRRPVSRPDFASGSYRAVLTPTQALIKRSFDVVFSLLMLLITLPLFAVVALVIKLDTPGPIFFCQTRVGMHGRKFTMYKFRTMYVNAEEILPHEQSSYYIKRPDDPRVTRSGRILRRTSLDELPQFVNVLRGEMSVVGPRPEVLWIAEHYLPWQWERVRVPQGITGWWQITGRAANPMQDNIPSDLYYIRNYSLWLDLRIMILTIPCILTGRGAF